MSAYAAGTVAAATLRLNGDRVRVMRTDGAGDRAWVAADTCLHVSERDLTDIRPLVVLNLNDPSPLVSLLRDDSRSPFDRSVSRGLADQIEAQTRPAIEEPKGLGAVVKAAKRIGVTGWFVHAGFGKWVEVGMTVDFSWDELTPIHVLSEGVTP